MCHFDHDKLPSWDDAPVHIPVDNVPVYSHHCEHWVVMVLNTLPVWTSQILSIMIMQSYEHLGKNEAMFFLLYLLLHFGHIFLLQLLRTKAETFERCWPWGNSVSFLFVLSLEVNPNYSSGWATENFCSIWNILCSRKFSIILLWWIWRHGCSNYSWYLRDYSLSPGDEGLILGISRSGFKSKLLTPAPLCSLG